MDLVKAATSKTDFFDASNKKADGVVESFKNKKKELYQKKSDSFKEELVEMLAKNGESYKAQYPNLNWIKYAFVTFKSNEAQEHVRGMFRESGCLGKICTHISSGKDVLFEGQPL